MCISRETLLPWVSLSKAGIETAETSRWPSGLEEVVGGMWALGNILVHFYWLVCSLAQSLPGPTIFSIYGDMVPVSS